MKVVLVILLVCIAGTYAQSGPFNGLIENLSATLQQTINNLLQSVISLLPNKPRLDISSLLASLNLQQVVHEFIDKLKEILVSMTAQLLGGSSKSALQIKTETEERIFAQLGDLAAQLGALTGNIIASIPNLGNILGKRDILGNLQAQIQSVIDSLKPEINNIINSVLSQILSGKRDAKANAILDFILNAFNLSGVWDTIAALGTQVVAQFTAIASQLLFAGQQVWNNAKPIFSQLVSDLTNHGSDAVTIVAQAIAQLNQVIAGAGKRAIAQRDLMSTIVSMLGLDQVWSTITALGSSVYLQFINIGTQLLFAGQQVWSQVKPVLSQLKDDLINHTGDAVTIVAQTIASLNQIIAAGKRDLAQRDLMSTVVSMLGLDQVWSTITALGSSVYLQFINIGTQLLFASQQVWSQVKPVLSQLKDNLINHTGDAVTIVAQSIASLNQILSGSGKRDLMSTIVSSLGLDQVWSTITALGSSVYLQFIQIGTQLLFAGQQIWAQAQVVLTQLKNDLINHTGDAVTIVSQAVASLNQILG